MKDPLALVQPWEQPALAREHSSMSSQETPSVPRRYPMLHSHLASKNNWHLIYSIAQFFHNAERSGI